MRLYAVMCGLFTLVLSLCLGLGTSSKGALTALSLLSSGFGAVIWGPLYSYSAERYPTTHRSIAMGLFTAVTATVTIITTYIGSIALNGKHDMWRLPLIWGSVRLSFAFATFFLKYEVNLKKLQDLN